VIPGLRQWLPAALIVSAVLAAAGASWTVRGWQADAEMQQLRAEHAQQMESIAQATQQAERVQRDEEQRRAAAVLAAADAERQRAKVLAARSADLERAAGQLRDHIARIVAGEASSDSTIADGSAPTTGAGLVLADLYRGVDREAIELAQAFDHARSRGLACEQAYDSLTELQAEVPQ
jgi:hypothetical protein